MSDISGAVDSWLQDIAGPQATPTPPPRPAIPPSGMMTPTPPKMESDGEVAPPSYSPGLPDIPMAPGTRFNDPGQDIALPTPRPRDPIPPSRPRDVEYFPPQGEAAGNIPDRFPSLSGGGREPLTDALQGSGMGGGAWGAAIRRALGIQRPGEGAQQQPQQPQQPQYRQVPPSNVPGMFSPELGNESRVPPPAPAGMPPGAMTQKPMTPQPGTITGYDRPTLSGDTPMVHTQRVGPDGEPIEEPPQAPQAQPGADQLLPESADSERQYAEWQHQHNMGLIKGTWPQWKKLWLGLMTVGIAIAAVAMRKSYVGLSALAGFAQGLSANSQKHSAEQYKELAKSTSESINAMGDSIHAYKDILNRQDVDLPRKTELLRLKAAELNDKQVMQALQKGNIVSLDGIFSKRYQTMVEMQQSLDQLGEIHDRWAYTPGEHMDKQYAKDYKQAAQEDEKARKKLAELEEKLKNKKLSDPDDKAAIQKAQKLVFEGRFRVQQAAQKRAAALAKMRPEGPQGDMPGQSAEQIASEPEGRQMQEPQDQEQPEMAEQEMQ